MAPSQTQKEKEKVVMNGAGELINMITLCNNTTSTKGKKKPKVTYEIY
jgi:hypothetical protein